MNALNSVVSTAVQPDAIADMETKSNASLTYATKSELNTHATEAKEYTDTVINNLVNAAPDTLDTLGELAQAILDNEDVVELLETSVTNKLDKSEAEQLYATNEDITVTEIVNVSNGVYAVTATGDLIDYNTADESCIGVALITDNQRIMIAKANATDGTNTTLYWGKNLQGKDVAGITNISDQSVAKTDFNGKANTAAIIAAYTEHGVDMDSRDMCKVLASYTEGGFTDWYVPSAGQLYEMYTKMSDINAALTKIGGTALESDRYWASSEHGAVSAWDVTFNYGGVLGNGKGYGSGRVRFVRDIPYMKKSHIKDKITTLGEAINQKQNVIEDLSTIR